MAEESRLRRDGRDIFWRIEDHPLVEPGSEIRIARIPDHLTPEEWERLYADGPQAEPDIVIPPTEAPLVGPIPGLRGRAAVQAVIAVLLGKR